MSEAAVPIYSEQSQLPSIGPGPGRRRAPVYAIGDVHGCCDLLDGLLTRILDDRAEEGGPIMIVLLGDYIDRGPHSKGVVDLLLKLRADEDVEARFIRGNHDQALLDFLEDPALGPAWCAYGGDATLASYGLTPPRPTADAATWKTLRDAFAAALPQAHLEFFRELEPFVIVEDFYFTHAGARPGVALADQDHGDLRSIRQPFLSDSAPFDKLVVHGHTPVLSPHVDARRIGLDTGAYATGALTCVRLGDNEPGFLTARRGRHGGGVSVSAEPSSGQA